MKQLTLVTVLVLSALALAVPLAWAGSPHFVDDTVNATRSGDSLIVSGKEAGLGDEAQVHIVVTATALCINPGNNHPQPRTRKASRPRVTSLSRTVRPTSASR